MIGDSRACWDIIYFRINDFHGEKLYFEYYEQTPSVPSIGDFVSLPCQTENGASATVHGRVTDRMLTKGVGGWHCVIVVPEEAVTYR